MSLMKKLFEQFAEEIDGVREYTKCSLAHKDDPALSKMYADMARQEIEHAKKLHAQITARASDNLKEEDAADILERLWADKQEEMAGELAEAHGYLGMLPAK